MQKVIQFYNRFYPNGIVDLCRIVGVILCALFTFAYTLSMLLGISEENNIIGWFFQTLGLLFLVFSLFIMMKRVYQSDTTEQSPKLIVASELVITSIALCLTLGMLIQLIDTDFEVMPILFFIAFAYSFLGLVLNAFIEIKNI